MEEEHRQTIEHEEIIEFLHMLEKYEEIKRYELLIDDDIEFCWKIFQPYNELLLYCMLNLS